MDPIQTRASSQNVSVQEPLSPILNLGVNLYRVVLLIKPLSGEVSHAHSSKTQSKQSHDSGQQHYTEPLIKINYTRKFGLSTELIM